MSLRGLWSSNLLCNLDASLDCRPRPEPFPIGDSKDLRDQSFGGKRGEQLHEGTSPAKMLSWQAMVRQVGCLPTAGPQR